MNLQKEERILKRLDKISNLEVIYIVCKSPIFYKRFSEVSKFFRSVKNGLYSTGGQTNRQFFKEISGVYFSLENQNNIEILIVYDDSIKSLNHLQITTRIKKLLGLSISVEIGDYIQYSSKIQDFLKIRRRLQPFGEIYFKGTET